MNTMDLPASVCPGCGLNMPERKSASYDGYYNTSPECWIVYTEVLEAEYSNAFLFGRIHQLTVDSYAMQHAGGKHPDKSVVVHLCGLHLVLERGLQPTSVPSLLQKLATRTRDWPHFEPPAEKLSLTVCDIALTGNVEDHIKLVREWSSAVWEMWGQHHSAVSAFLNSVFSNR